MKKKLIHELLGNNFHIDAIKEEKGFDVEEQFEEESHEFEENSSWFASNL